MNFFVILTTECDLKCSYCYGKIWDEGCDEVPDREIDCFLPKEISYSISKLAEFCSKDSDCGLLLYGGEPLLQMEKLKEVMDKVPAKRFILQTNGMLLDQLPLKYVIRLNGIQVSIDGDKDITDRHRGSGVYGRIMTNIRLLENFYGGEVIARMTATEDTDIYKQVTHLLGTGAFDAVHWQIDACFGPDYDKRNFSRWSAGYNRGITRLARLWLRALKKGSVLRLYPFLGVMNSMLCNEDSRLRCGAGYAHYAIQTDGNIVPCPVMAGMKRFYAGNLDSEPRRLKEFDVGAPCTSCSIKNLCGGRCLFANAHKFWGPRGFDEVCGTVRHLIKTMQGIQPDVERLIKQGRITMESLDYTRFNSCEITP